jgi:hypothetical protein
MGTYTADPVSLYKPTIGESPATWPSLVNLNFDAIATIFASRIQIYNGDIQSYDGVIQLY